VLALGVADSMIGPYLVLFGTQPAHLSPLQIGVFTSLTSVSGLAVTGTLHRPDSEVGQLFTVCALVEIPAALVTMPLPAGVRKWSSWPAWRCSPAGLRSAEGRATDQEGCFSGRR
jgi:hypothetical protein